MSEELWTGDRGIPEASTFGRVKDADESLHPLASIPGDTLTETWAYMWYVPEARISAMVHIWVHPNLGVVTPGIGVFQGFKNSAISAEIMDARVFHSAAELGDGRNMRFASGLHVEILEPFRKIRIRYEDTARGNAVDLTVSDFAPPVMRGSENHFDQATVNRGTMTLRGKTYEVNCLGMRDRSWGQLRTESSVPAPPFTWMTGTFAASKIAWNLAAFDDPAQSPIWQGLFDVKREDMIHDGWVWSEGRLSRLTDAWQTTVRDPHTLRPVSHRLHFMDDRGRSYDMTGRVIASVPWNSWTNMSAYICCTEWTMGKEVGWGDTQDCQWGDFQYALRADQDPPPSSRL